MFTEDAYFGRRVVLTISTFDSVLKESSWITNYFTEATQDGITLEFNRDDKNNTDLCPRIDFWVRQSAFINTEAGAIPNTQQAKIDLYNIGPAVRQFLDAYNDYINATAKVPKLGITLQVGNNTLNNNGSLSTIFVGFLSSFSVERKQTAKTVDDVWHLLCWYPFNSDIPDMTLANDLTKEGLIENAQKIASQPIGTAEECLKNWIMSAARCVYNQSALSKIDINSNIISAVMQDKIKTIFPIRTEITPSNFNKYFEIRYLMDGDKDKPNIVLAELWKGQQFRYVQVPSCELTQGIKHIARYLNCDAEVDVNKETGKTTISIYQAGARLINSYTADYSIINFQNLVRPPEVSANMLILTMLLEPSVCVGKTVSLLLDESFNGKTPSFIPNYSFGNTTNVFAGSDFAGAQYTYKQNAMKGYGNIFNKQYIIRFVDFQGSTHDDVWITRMECCGALDGDSVIQE